MEHLEPGAQTDDDAATDTFTGLLENAVGGLGRVGDREHVEQSVQFFFAACGEELIDLPNVASVLRVAPFHIKYQGLQQIHFSVVPEMVSLPVAGVFNDDVAEKLGHQLLALDFGQAVPGIGGGGGHQIEHLHRVPLIPEVGAAFFVEL